jgi:hypothetical protein
MKRFLVALALLAAPFTASAAGLLPFQSPYKQLKSMAQSQGMMQKGSGQRLYLKYVQKPVAGKPGVIAATIKGTGGMTGNLKNVTVASGNFNVVSIVDGLEVQDGKFAPRMYLMGGAK